jgi:hypothetical protein
MYAQAHSTVNNAINNNNYIDSKNKLIVGERAVEIALNRC